MRVREDSWWEAGKKRAVENGAVPDPRDEPNVNWDPGYLRFLNEPAQEGAKDGDVWVIRQSPEQPTLTSSVLGGHEDWPIVGYILTCPEPSCAEGVHRWQHARDCEGDFGKPCKNGGPSCWTWTGSPEDDTLTAVPSLFVPKEYGGCGWHGFLRNGRMVSV